VKLTMFVITLGLAYPCFSQMPIPPGVRQADKVEAQSQQNIPPASVQRTPLDFAKLKNDAQELATLAASVPSEVNQTTMGMMPKDLEQNLKRIEKLAKHLRSQISH
jgi:ribosomal protein S15P/S13E